MSSPLYISQCVRRGGKTYLTVVGHGFTAANIGNKLQVAGCPDPSVNVTNATISGVIVPDTIVFNQPGLLDIPAGLVGGAVAVG